MRLRYGVLGQDRSSDIAFWLWSGMFRECGAVGVGDAAGDAAGEGNEGGFLQVIYK